MYINTVGLIILVVSVFLIGYLAGRRQANSADRQTSLKPTMDPSFQADVSQEVQDLLRSGKKIDAIKAYREQTGAGLKEAKAVIDRMAAEMYLTSFPPGDTGTSIGQEKVQDLLRSGKKIEAIKLYREQTGAGLKEAKAAIDQMEMDGLI